MKSYYVYILASRENGTLYIGVTNNLPRRMYEHRNGLVEGFTKNYTVHRLVYFEETPRIDDAITKEKQLKNWRRLWKLELINETNPEWRDLADELSIGS